MEKIDRNISDLIGAEYNPREDSLEHLKDAIKRFDAAAELLNIIISGHQRIKEPNDSQNSLRKN